MGWMRRQEHVGGRQIAISREERQAIQEIKDCTDETGRNELEKQCGWLPQTKDHSSARLEESPVSSNSCYTKKITGLVVQDPSLHAHWPRSAFYHGRFIAECSLSYGPSYYLQHVPFGLSAMGENKASSPRHAFDPHCITNDLMNILFYCQQSCAMYFVKPSMNSPMEKAARQLARDEFLSPTQESHKLC